MPLAQGVRAAPIRPGGVVLGFLGVCRLPACPAANAAALAEVEDRILSVLSSSSGNILDDETAINIITQAKALGNDIAEKQATAAVTEAAIDEARKGYAPCGDYMSTLFFAITGTRVSVCILHAAHHCRLIPPSGHKRAQAVCSFSPPAASPPPAPCPISGVSACRPEGDGVTDPMPPLLPPADLGLIDPMYQYSLPWFIGLMLASVAAAERPEGVAPRLEAIHQHFTFALYRNVCRWAGAGRGGAHAALLLLLSLHPRD
jgi:hypothetical protein